jgi:hypothetical protein
MANSVIKNYKILDNGLIKQEKILNKLKKYNKEYIDQRYNTYGPKRYQMAGLRLGYLLGAIDEIPNTILDIGYGNGDFLDLCKNYIKNCFGNDITGYPLPENVKFIENIFESFYDVICFFDVLEHFSDINFIKDLQCKYIFVSVPWCHFFSEEWFLNWKHRRPDEHLWHFNNKSIVAFFKECGYSLVKQSNIEDSIRTNSDSVPNILSCIFKKYE